MIVYFDTSALIKRYIAEANSDVISDLWETAELVASSQLLYAEMIATFARKRREQPAAAATINAVEQAFRDDWNVLYRIAIDDQLGRRLDALLAKYALRGADAVHLASALLFADLVQAPVIFACADAMLVSAARAEGLSIAP